MRSEEVKRGSTRAAHRSLFYAMGYTEEDLKKPLIGVVNAQNEIIPGHMHLDQIAKAVKHGILAAGGTPIEFPAIGICDGMFPLFLKPPVVLKQEKSTKQNSASSNMPHAQAAAAVLVCSLLTL